MNYRSPLSKAKGLGSAGAGAHHWKVQRITSVALVPLTLWFVFAISSLDVFAYDAFVEWLSRPWVPVLLTLFFGTAYYHASLGIQVVVEDYVHNELARHALVIGIRLLLMLMAASTIVSILLTAL
ncbi:MAG: succinate dehydrogenase, hydrophobic membrane anchor protein [Proteobacteria bacterium]|nr:MAG: succinate dehydrogenase, hydrophobic membrane anchor protein [Pseudomonadota bacterium]